jgi:hypothetical protein
MPLTTFASQGDCAAPEPQHHEQTLATPPLVQRRDGPTVGFSRRERAARSGRLQPVLGQATTGPRPAPNPRGLCGWHEPGPARAWMPTSAVTTRRIASPTTLKLTTHFAAPRPRSPSPATVPRLTATCPGRGPSRAACTHDPASPCRSL